MDKSIERSAFQGLWNVIRFNKHFFIVAFFLIIILCVVVQYTTGVCNYLAERAVLILLCINLCSLMVTYYIYDFSGLYEMNFLKELDFKKDESIININAGFDETSAILKKKINPKRLQVIDFYNPEKHTERSIKIARKAYPPYLGTIKAKSNAFLLPSGIADKVFAIFSIHEIRDHKEREACILEIKRVLKQNGQLIIIEHLRDPINFLAYNIGFLHFFSHKTWLKAIMNCDMNVLKTKKITPFLNMYIIENYGNSY